MRISVVIPCYNRESRIAAAIGSALAQDLAPLEVLVVDDGSTDHSADVADGFGDAVRVIRTANAGPSAARNRGIEEATGDWIAFLDSDDTWSPEKLSAQAAALEVFPGAELVFSDTRTLIDGLVDIESRFDLGGVREAAVERRGHVMRFDRSLFVRLLEQSRIFTSAVLVRRALPGLYFRESFKGPEDWALWLSLSLHHPFAAVDRVHVDMNYDGDNLTARYAPILGSGVDVLEELAGEPSLTKEELSALNASLGRRRIGALYHSLVEGDCAQARRLLAAVPRPEIGTARWWRYWLLSRIPGWLLRGLVKTRSEFDDVLRS